MGKFEKLMESAGANTDESLGHGRNNSDLTIPKIEIPARLQGVTKSKNTCEIPIDRVQPDRSQPREIFDAESLERLSISMRSRGQLQPIVVKWSETNNTYTILCGERRWRAAILAGMSTIRAEVVERELTPTELLSIRVIENCLREDLTAIEQSKAYKSLMEQNNWTTPPTCQ